MADYLDMFVTGTLPKEIELLYTFNYVFDRESSQYGTASGRVQNKLNNETSYDVELATNLYNQILCIESNINATFPANITMTQKTNQDTATTNIPTGD